jgi:signal transduction histidine kinase
MSIFLPFDARLTRCRPRRRSKQAFLLSDCGAHRVRFTSQIGDSGAGFDSEAAKESRGLGLISMEERLKLLKGTFSIESQPKRGATIQRSRAAPRRLKKVFC